MIDPHSTANAALALDERTELLVIGAGPAGLAAAIAAAGHGLRVVLVDENPVPPEVMGDDIPLHWGQRMSGAVRNRSAMTEALLASDAAARRRRSMRAWTCGWAPPAGGCTPTARACAGCPARSRR